VADRPGGPSAPGPSGPGLGVVVAVTGAWEAPLVADLDRSRELLVLRRCADVAELLAAVGTGRARALLVSADLHRLDRAVVARVRAAGVAVVALAAPAALVEQEPRLRALGVDAVLAADAPAAEVAAAVHAVVGAPADHTAPGGGRPLRAAEGVPAGPGRRADLADPADALAPEPAAGGADPFAALLEEDPTGARPRGRLVAVWGPAGSPGRTTVAVETAAELAAAGDDVLLADADTHAACVAQVLGVLDESPGLAAACRAAGTGALDGAALQRLSVEVVPRLRLLSGIARSARWPELSTSSLERVWEVARERARWVVVDLAAPLEADEELVFDTAAPRRNGATLGTLAAADVVLVVGTADAVGLQRLVRGLADLAEAVPDAATPRVVVTRVRASSVGAGPETRVRDAVRRFAGVADPVLVPDDRPALDAALLAGRTLAETAPRSPARTALAGLAASLRAEGGAGPGPTPRGRRWWRAGSGRGRRRAG